MDEDVALAGQIGFTPNPSILGSLVTINGFRLAYVNSTTTLSAVQNPPPGAFVPPYILKAGTNLTYSTIFLGGQTNEIRQPITGDPITDSIMGQARLTSNEVVSILALAADRARTTRAAIRLPRGQISQAFITVVNNPFPYTNGLAPVVLGTIRTPGATMFSWDVAVQKARTAIFYSSTNYAFSVRAVGFLAQEFYPPGIENTEPGLFWGMQERFSMFPQNVMNPLDGVVVTNVPSVNPYLPNGITIFPRRLPVVSQWRVDRRNRCQWRRRGPGRSNLRHRRAKFPRTRSDPH